MISLFYHDRHVPLIAELYALMRNNFTCKGLTTDKTTSLLPRSITTSSPLGYIKEPKGVDFVVEPHVVTEEDRAIISEAIAHYKATGKFKRVPKSKKVRRVSKKIKR